MAQARRIYLYVMAFAGLITLLVGVSGLAALGLVTLTLPDATLVAGDVRQQASFYLAAIIISLPVTAGHWLWAQRLAAASAEERAAFMRRLFLAAVFGTTAVVALYGLCGALIFALTLPGTALSQPSWPAGIQAMVRLAVYGGAWLGFKAISSEQDTRADRLHDVAVYVLTGFSLGFLVSGVGQSIGELVRTLVIAPEAGRVLLAGPERLPLTVWGAIAAWILSGGIVWGLVWLYDLRRAGRRIWRVVYLYVVLMVAAPAFLGGAAYGAYELLRKALGFRMAVGSWDFLQVSLPLFVVGGAVWAYHWLVLRRQAAADDTAVVPWPRRPAIALLSLLGIAAATPAFVGLIWVALDFALNNVSLMSGPDWWRDRLSLSLAGGVIGTLVWLGGWSRLEKAATAQPEVERATLARKLYLGSIVLGAALAALGFLVALLWLTLRLALGEPASTPVVTSAFEYLATTLVCGALAGYHALILRRDLIWSRAVTRRPHLFVLLEPGARSALEELEREGVAEVRLLGEVRGPAQGASLEVKALAEAAARLESEGRADGELVILGAERGRIYPFEKRTRTQALDGD